MTHIPDMDFDPARRFNRAKVLLENRKPKGEPRWAKSDDKTVQRLYQLLKEMADGVEYTDKEARRAHMLWLESARSSPRHILEAMALAKASDNDIADCSGLSAGVVAFYIASFFDVRVNGGRERYIARMGSDLTTYSHDLFHDMGYKRVAAHGGLDLFKRLVLRHAPLTESDVDWLEREEYHLKAVHSWSMAWEGFNPKVQRHEPKRALVEQMNPRKHVQEREASRKSQGTGGSDELSTLLDAFASVARPRVASKKQ